MLANRKETPNRKSEKDVFRAFVLVISLCLNKNVVKDGDAMVMTMLKGAALCPGPGGQGQTGSGWQVGRPNAHPPTNPISLAHPSSPRLWGWACPMSILVHIFSRYEPIWHSAHQVCCSWDFGQCTNNLLIGYWGRLESFQVQVQMPKVQSSSSSLRAKSFIKAASKIGRNDWLTKGANGSSGLHCEFSETSAGSLAHRSK